MAGEAYTTFSSSEQVVGRTLAVANVVHPRVPDLGLCAFVLSSAPNLVAGTTIPPADRRRLLRTAVWQQVPGRLCLHRRVIFIVPYLQLQLTGLGIIVEVASADGVGRTAS